MSKWPNWQKFFAAFTILSVVLFVMMITVAFLDRTGFERQPCVGLGNTPAGPAPKAGSDPEVQAVVPIKALVLGAPICVRIAGLKDWLTDIKHKDQFDKLTLFVNHMRIPKLVGTVWNIEKGLVQFSLLRSKDNAEAWTTLIGTPSPSWDRLGKVVWTIGAGPSSDAGFGQVDGVELEFMVLDPLALGFGLVALLFAVLAPAILGPNTSILRDGDINSPFSLARCQMAFWLYLITASFIYIWLVIGDANSVLTPQALVLLGISATTGLAAVAMDSTSPQQAGTTTTAGAASAMGATGAAMPPAPTLRQKVDPGLGRTWAQYLKRFAKDLLSSRVNGVDSIQLHRVQLLVWTLILGCIFLWEVYRSYVMPSFDTNLLLMMGISGGLYIGFKTREA